MPAPHALYSKMLAERTASRNVLVLFYLFIYSALAKSIRFHRYDNVNSVTTCCARMCICWHENKHVIVAESVKCVTSSQHRGLLNRSSSCAARSSSLVRRPQRKYPDRHTTLPMARRLLVWGQLV